jgi:hypothetical protein
MKSLKNYILEEKKEDKEKTTRRGNIKFTIWEEPDKRVNWLDDNKSYQKIEYKHEDKDKKIFIDFLLGFKDNSWRVWIGKIGSTSDTQNSETLIDAKELTISDMGSMGMGMNGPMGNSPKGGKMEHPLNNYHHSDKIAKN